MNKNANHGSSCGHGLKALCALVLSLSMSVQTAMVPAFAAAVRTESRPLEAEEQRQEMPAAEQKTALPDEAGDEKESGGQFAEESPTKPDDPQNPKDQENPEDPENPQPDPDPKEDPGKDPKEDLKKDEEDQNAPGGNNDSGKEPAADEKGEKGDLNDADSKDKEEEEKTDKDPEEKEDKTEQEESGSRPESKGDVKVASYQHLVISMPWGGSITNGIWKLTNGMTAFCGDGLSTPPTTASVPLSNPVKDSRPAVRKALYYGYNGPSNQLGSFTKDQQIILTNEFISIAHCGRSISQNTSGGFHWNSGVRGWYESIQKLPDPPAGYTVYYVPFADENIINIAGTKTVQPLFYGVMEQVQQYGSIRLIKKGSHPELTAGNPNYSLAGAVYGIYGSEQNALTDAGRLGTLTVQADGTSNVCQGLQSALTVYVKEISAPPGYASNPQIYTAKIGENTTVQIEAQDTPLYADGFARIVKKGILPAADLPLSKARYQVTFRSENAQSSRNERVWVFETDENGIADFADPAQKVSGDDLFTNVIKLSQ